MRSRTVREGSVGLLFLIGIGLFGALIVWLRGTYFSDRTYQFTVEFANAAGMQIGTPVRYRGVTVGQVIGIKPGANGVDVEIQIVQTELAIPRNVEIEANQSGLIGENSIDIMPATNIPVDIQGVNPTDSNCQERDLIICNNARLQGRVGVSLDELIRVTVRFANLYTDPRFFNNINSTLQNASAAARGVTQLTRDLSGLTASLKQELRNISVAANAVGQTANQLGGTANKFGATADKLNRTIDKFGVSADRVTVAATQTTGKINTTLDRVSGAVGRLSNTADRTASRVALTADRASGLVTNLNNLLETNKASLVSTLNNLSQTSEQLRVTVANLSPTIDRVTQGELIRNLETLSANAAQASTNIRDFSNAVNNPTNLLALQQTLDSARVTFQNAQKITSDLDDLTGDPAFRNNLRNLVNGLSGLVSSTEQLQQQVEVAQFLAPMAEATNMQMPHAPVVNAPISVTSPGGEGDRNFQIPQSTASKDKKPPISNE